MAHYPLFDALSPLSDVRVFLSPTTHEYELKHIRWHDYHLVYRRKSATPLIGEYDVTITYVTLARWLECGMARVENRESLPSNVSRLLFLPVNDTFFAAA